MAPEIKYRPEMPQEMIDMMRQGAKDSWIWAQWGISKTTFYRWRNEYPKLEQAHDEGMPLCQVWWERKGMEFMAEGNHKAFNFWIAFMNNKFGWSQRSQGGDTNIHVGQLNVFQQQSKEELLKVVQAGLLEHAEDLNLLENTSVIAEGTFQEVLEDDELEDSGSNE